MRFLTYPLINFSWVRERVTVQARKYLISSAISVPCERLFSLAGHIVTKMRAALKLWNFEAFTLEEVKTYTVFLHYVHWVNLHKLSCHPLTTPSFTIWSQSVSNILGLGLVWHNYASIHGIPVNFWTSTVPNFEDSQNLTTLGSSEDNVVEWIKEYSIVF